MCSCGNSKDCTNDEYFTATSEFEPAVSTWQDAADAEFCSHACPFSSPPRTPRPDRTAPSAPLRQLSRRPELAVGVAIARRLDFDTPTWADSSYNDMDLTDDSEPSFPGHLPRGPPIASSTFRYPQSQFREAPSTYKLHRVKPPMISQPPKQYLPRMTKMTPCGKCLRM